MFQYPRMKITALAGLCHRLGTALSAGIDLRKAWEREANRAQGRTKEALEHVSRQLMKGQSIFQTVSEVGETFPPVMRNMLRVGEETGHVDRVFLELAKYFQNLDRMRRIFLTGLLWPMIQFMAAVLVTSLLIFLNKFVRKSSDGQFDLLGIGLEGGIGVVVFLSVIGSSLFALFLILRQWSRGKWGAHHALRVIGRIPVLGECLRTFALGRMAWSLALTTNTAMNVQTSMRLALANSAHPVFMGLGDPVCREIASGAGIYQSLYVTNCFPDDFLDAIAVGEETGQLSESMHRLSEQYTERARATANLLAVVASFVVWGIVALLIAVILIRIIASYVAFITSLTDAI